MVLELFKMYDSDGSGQLDEDEFIAVLMQTGECLAFCRQMAFVC